MDWELFKRKDQDEKDSNIQEHLNQQTIDDRFNKMNKLLLEIYTKFNILDENIRETEEHISGLESSTSKIREQKDKYKQHLQDIKKKMKEEIVQEIKSYKERVNELKRRTNEAIKNYNKTLRHIHTEVIQPLGSIYEKGERLRDRLNRIEKELNNISLNIENYEKLAQEYAKAPEVVQTIVAKYARRSDLEKESEWVVELLDETPDTLKTAIKIGREMGYTNNQLMPIIGAYGLKIYREGRIDEEACREIDIDKKRIDNYITDIIFEAKNSSIRNKLLQETRKI